MSTVVCAATLISGTPEIPILGFQARVPYKLQGWQDRPKPASRRYVRRGPHA